MMLVKQTLHKWNIAFQKTFLMLVSLTYILSFFNTLYNVIHLFFGVDSAYILPTVRSVTLMVGSIIILVGCLFTTSLFDTLVEDERE